MIRSWEEDSTPDHFPHDAPHRPDVHVLLVAHAQDDLGRAVVSEREDINSVFLLLACLPIC